MSPRPESHPDARPSAGCGVAHGRRPVQGRWLWRWPWLCLALLPACRTPAPTPAQDPDEWAPTWRRESPSGWLERGYLHIGERDLTANNLPFDDSQLAIGLEIIGAPPGTPVEFALGLFGSANAGGPGSWIDLVFGKPEAETDASGAFEDGEQSSAFEISLGLHKELSLLGGWLRPHAGLGLAGIQQRRFEIVAGDTESFSDADLGYYAQTGLRLLFARGASIGLALRWLEGTDLDLGGVETSADYFQWAFTLSFFA